MCMGRDKTHSKKLLIGTFYRPPNAPIATLTAIGDSIGMATDTNAHDKLLTGAFNINMADGRNSIKIKDLCQEYGLSQLISDSTHFTETSQSTIDNCNDILTRGVGKPFLDQNIRYHCPVFCVLDFQKPKIRSFKRHIWLFDRENYQALSTELNNTNWDNLKDADINKYCRIL